MFLVLQFIFINLLVQYCSRVHAFLSPTDINATAQRAESEVVSHRRTSRNAATDAWGVGRECAVETQSHHIGCPLPPERKQETRGAAVLNNGPAPHQPGLKRPHSVPWLYKGCFQGDEPGHAHIHSRHVCFCFGGQFVSA